MSDDDNMGMTMVYVVSYDSEDPEKRECDNEGISLKCDDDDDSISRDCDNDNVRRKCENNGIMRERWRRGFV